MKSVLALGFLKQVRFYEMTEEPYSTGSRGKAGGNPTEGTS